MMAIVQSAAVANYCSTTGRGAGELSLLVPLETVAGLDALMNTPPREDER